MANPKEIQLGDEVQDTVTGFKGIAVARTEWLNGCDRICVQPEGLTKDKTITGDLTFDELQLKILRKGKVKSGKVEEPKLALTGGPRPNLRQRATPKRR